MKREGLQVVLCALDGSIHYRRKAFLLSRDKIKVELSGSEAVGMEGSGWIRERFRGQNEPDVETDR